MKKTFPLIILLIVGAGVGFLLMARSIRNAKGNSRAGVTIAPPSSDGSDPSPGATPCPGMRECTAAENDTPSELQIAFHGPNNITLHGHLYVPGRKFSSRCAECKEEISGDDLQPWQRSRSERGAASGQAVC